MSGFSNEWLRLREPFDLAAREAASQALALPRILAAWRQRSASSTLDVVDLACGNAANLRALAPVLGGAQHWRLLDHDQGLLAAVPPTLAEWARDRGYRLQVMANADGPPGLRIDGPGFSARVDCQRFDLGGTSLSFEIGPHTLITASALLDLVSARWLRRLIEAATVAGAAMLFALSVDGRIEWQPADADDAAVAKLFARHQCRDKGFGGPALGPQAGAVALQCLLEAGYQAMSAPSDWHVDGAHAAAMLRAMIGGIADAAIQQQPAAQALLGAWRTRRLAAVGASRLCIGHVDVFATPPQVTGCSARSQS
jgi:hypothetical protein